MKKIKVWYNSLGITVKYIFIIIVIAIPLIVGAVYTSSKNDDMDYYGISFNIVQAERMRTFLVSNYVQQIYTGNIDGDSNQVTYAENVLNEQIPIYLEHIDYLKYGDSFLNLPPASNDEIIEKLEIIIPMMDNYTDAAQKVIDDPTDTVSRDYVVDNALLLDKEMYELTVLYESIYITGYNQLSSMSVLVVLVTVFILVSSLLLLRILRKNEYFAKYDYLTKVRSRSLIFDDIKNLKADNFTVFYIDIKSFKQINDVYGNLIGDEILIEFAERLKHLSNTEYVYRYAGDEFVILIEGEEFSSKYVANIENYKNMLLVPFIDGKGRKHILRISMGVVLNNVGMDDFEKKINLAMDLQFDSANYKLKPMICDTFEKTQSRIELKNAIETAIEKKQIVAYFQPLFKRDGTLKGFETLARWHFNGKVINPGTFIPLINRNGMGFELDMFMIELVGEAYGLIQNANKDIDPYISINLAIDTINNVKISDLIKSLDKTNDKRENIILEILEDVIIGDKTRSKLAELKRAGYQIALDDFTTGATSFEYLKIPEIDYIKIDKQVLKGLEGEGSNNIILEDLIKMIHSSNKQVIIEGVETLEELTIMRDLNVDVIQGYYYAKPLPIKEAVEFLKKL